VIAFDIETIPDVRKVDALPEPEAPGNYKDPEKIAHYVYAEKMKQVEKMALSPWTGRICSIATWSDYQSDRNYYTMMAVDDKEETVIIEEALELFVIHQGYHPKVLTWNGWEFDLPFLFIRAMLLGVKLPAGLPPLKAFQKKYDSTLHIDVMQEISMWRGRMSLENAARELLGQKKADLDFREFPALIAAGNYDVIGRYNLRDAELTFEIYKKCQSYLF
jgi:DNA polymerase elongation subunit (family B)